MSFGGFGGGGGGFGQQQNQPQSTPFGGGGGGLFGQQQQQQQPTFGQPGASTFGGGTTGFGATTQTSTGFGATATPAFGAGTGFGGTSGAFSTPGPSAGASTTFGGGGLGSSSGTTGFGSTGFGGGGAFGAAKTGGFGTTGASGTTTATGGFGSPFGGGGGTGTGSGGGFASTAAAPSTSAFGMGSSSPWGASTARAAQPGTGNPPYKPTQHHDNNTNVPTYIQAITAMEAFREKSFEELRWEDYQRGNNKGGTLGGGISPLQGGGLGLGGTGTGGFGAPATTTSTSFGGFGSKPAGFGATSTTAGAFGSTLGGGLSATPTTTGFGGTGAASTGFGGFGTAAKPGGVFGSTPGTSTLGSTLGGPLGGATTTPSTTGFGASISAPGGLGAFGAAKPGGFGTTSTSTPVGGLGSGFGGTAGGLGTGGFGSTTGSAFGTPAPAPAPFGSTPSTFGGTTSTFGATPSATGAFGTPAPAPFGASVAAPTSTTTPSFTSFGAAKTPAPSSFSSFGTTGASTGGFGSTFGGLTGTPSTSGAFGTPAPAPFGATTVGATATPSFTSSFGAKTPGLTTASGISPSFSTFSTPGAGTTGAFGSSFGAGGGLLGFGGATAAPTTATSTPLQSGSLTGTPFGTPNFALGGNSMQASLQQTPGLQQQLVPFGIGAQQQQQQSQQQLQQQLQRPLGALDQKPLQILVSGSGAKRSIGGRLRGESLDATPAALQSYRHTPRSAAKIVPRGLRGERSSRAPIGLSREEDYTNIVSPGSDSFSGRTHKHLDIGREDVFAAESKIFDLEDLPRQGDRLVEHPDHSRGPAKTNLPTTTALGGPSKSASSPSRAGESKMSPEKRVAESVAAPILTMEDYYCSPPLTELQRMDKYQLQHVRNFSITRRNVGRIEWEGETDVVGLNLDHIVNIQPKEVRVYEDSIKDPEGYKLNKPAVITLFSVRHKKKSPEEYREHLFRITQSWDGAEFLDYDLDTGRWTFRVAHFSKYGVEDDDDEGDEEGKNDLTANALITAAIAQKTGVGYGVADSDGDTDKEEEGMAVEESFPVQRAFEMSPTESEHEYEEEEEEFPSSHLPAATSYALEQGRIKTLVGLFGDSSHGDDFEAREEDEMEGFRDEEDLRRSWYPRSRGRYSPLPEEADVEEKMDESLLQISPSPKKHLPDIAFPTAFTYIEVSYIRQTGAVGGVPADEGLLKVLEGSAPSSSTATERKPVDFSSFMGRSFRVGWGPNGTVVMPFWQQSCVSAEISNVKVKAMVSLKNLTVDSSDESSYLRPLHVHKLHSQRVEEGDTSVAPLFALHPSTNVSLQRIDKSHLYFHLVKCLQALSKDALEREDELASETWELINALWGQEGAGGEKQRNLPLTGSLSLVGEEILGGVPTANDWERRRQAVGRWLKRVVRKESELTPLKASGDETTDMNGVLNLMRSNRIQEAAILAAEAGMIRLATLIPLAGHRPATDALSSQLSLQQGLQDPGLSTIFKLLGGREGVENPGLDWMRSLGEYFWFRTEESPALSNTNGLIASIQQFNERKPAPPLPAWLRRRYESSSTDVLHDARKGPNSILYDLLQLYRSEKYPASLLLDPRGITEQELDYRMSWFVMSLMEALGIGEFPDATWKHVTLSMVYQLTKVGMWQWAIYVVLHTKDAAFRTRTTRDLLRRYAFDFGYESSEWKFLVEELGLPKPWLEESRSIFLRAQGLFFQENEDDALHHAMQAGDWRLASEIAMNIVAPRFLIDDRGQELRLLLSRFFSSTAMYSMSPNPQANKACWSYLEFLEELSRLGAAWGEEANMRRFQDYLAGHILPNLIQGNDNKNCFSWRATRLGPEEAGLEADMYSEEEPVRDSTTPPSLCAIRDMVVTDVIKKLFLFHRLHSRTLTATGVSEKSSMSIFPRKAEVCRLDSMLMDYSLQQVAYLTGDLCAHLDSLE